MKFIIGKKLNMTQVFREDGTVVPVTRVQAGPCVITQVKTQEKEGTAAVQVGFGTQKTFRLTKPLQGHLKGITKDENAQLTVQYLHDFKNDNDLKRGDVFTVDTFSVGDKVQVTGVSKGKGFQGVVKRHGFHGGPASHGHKDNLRMPGSIGAGGVQRVFKNMRMAGHMGSEKIIVKNLEIVEVHESENEILIKGALPGSRNSLVYIFSPEGNIAVNVEKPIVESVDESFAQVEQVEIAKDDTHEKKTEVDVASTQESEIKDESIK